MTKEIVTDSRGKKTVYKDGRPIGEIEHRGSKDVAYDSSGKEVSETRHERDWRGGPKDTTYVSGREVSETRHEKSWDQFLLGHNKLLQQQSY